MSDTPYPFGPPLFTDDAVALILGRSGWCDDAYSETAKVPPEASSRITELLRALAQEVLLQMWEQGKRTDAEPKAKPGQSFSRSTTEAEDRGDHTLITTTTIITDKYVRLSRRVDQQS